MVQNRYGKFFKRGWIDQNDGTNQANLILIQFATYSVFWREKTFNSVALGLCTNDPNWTRWSFVAGAHLVPNRTAWHLKHKILRTPWSCESLKRLRNLQYLFQSCPKNYKMVVKWYSFRNFDQNSLPQCIDRLRRGKEIQCSADALGFESRADGDFPSFSITFPSFSIIFPSFSTVFHQFSTNFPMFSSMNHWILHPRPARCPLQHHPTVLSRCIKRCCCPIMGVMIIMDNHGWYIWSSPNPQAIWEYHSKLSNPQISINQRFSSCPWRFPNASCHRRHCCRLGRTSWGSPVPTGSGATPLQPSSLKQRNIVDPKETTALMVSLHHDFN